MLCKRCPAYSGRDSILGFSWELRVTDPWLPDYVFFPSTIFLSSCA